ncbi:MAG: DUF5034 domain-containing protein, partial [Bacteroides sp.]|nr:DUF5034 domain-containing protein [Bacteroides sp.]
LLYTMFRYKLLFLLFILFTAMRCHDDDPETIVIPATLTEVELTHLDNTGEVPVRSQDHRIKAEAYMLCIGLIIDTEPYESDYSFYIPTFTDAIRKIDIYVSTESETSQTSGTLVSDRFKDYPLALEDQLYDVTSIGELLTQCKQTSLYKAMLYPLAPGRYTFRVVCTLVSGKTVEADSTPVEFY